jgi:hypothetical protein
MRWLACGINEIKDASALSGTVELGGVIDREQRVFEPMTAEHNPPDAGQVIHCMEDLIPGELGKHLNQLVQANDSLFFQPIKNLLFQ